MCRSYSVQHQCRFLRHSVQITDKAQELLVPGAIGSIEPIDELLDRVATVETIVGTVQSDDNGKKTGSSAESGLPVDVSTVILGYNQIHIQRNSCERLRNE